MKVSVSVPAVYNNVDLLQGIKNAAKNGFSTVEVWALGDTDRCALKDVLAETGAHLRGFCPETFVMNVPALRDDYVQKMEQALETAAYLGTPSLITQVGQATEEAKEAQLDAVAETALRVAPMLRDAGVTLLIEPLNSKKDHVGYLLDSSEDGFELIKRVNSPNVRLIYDIYHQLWMGEDVEKQIFSNLPLIKHFHVAGLYERDEALFGPNYNYEPLLRRIAAEVPDLYVGAEFFPGDAEKGTQAIKTIMGY